MPRGGQPLPKPSRSDVARFWAKVDRSGGVSACWPWQAAFSNTGYGRFKIAGKLVSPHRLAYVIAHGAIPACDEYHGFVVMHACDNRVCCNPAHLSLGRQVDNVRDMDQKRRGCRAGYQRYPDELVAQIRSSPASSRELGRQIGVADGYIRKLRRGESRKGL